MKLNEACMQDVIEYLIKNLEIKVYINERGTFKSITVANIVKQMEDKYCSEDIWYSVYTLYNRGYIECSFGIKEKDEFWRSGVGFESARVWNVTYSGHNYLMDIKGKERYTNF